MEAWRRLDVKSQPADHALHEVEDLRIRGMYRFPEDLACSSRLLWIMCLNAQLLDTLHALVRMLDRDIGSDVMLVICCWQIHFARVDDL